MIYNWKIAFTNIHFRNKFIISVIVLVIILICFWGVLAHIENQQGHNLYDAFLNFIKPNDVSDFIFFVTYLTAFIGILYSLLSPYQSLHLIQMYSILTLLRLITLFFVPLGSPTVIIPLRDAILTHTFYAGNENMKDLFFSGHAATLFLFFFFANNKVLKVLFLVSAIMVSIGVVLQHVNYSYDVLAAPIFAYIAYRVIIKFSKHYYSEVPQ